MNKNINFGKKKKKNVDCLFIFQKNFGKIVDWLFFRPKKLIVTLSKGW